MRWPISTISFNSCALRTVGFLSIVAFFDEICDALVGLYVMHSQLATLLWSFYGNFFKIPCFDISSSKVASYHCMVYVTCYNTSPRTSITSIFHLVYSCWNYFLTQTITKKKWDTFTCNNGISCPIGQLECIQPKCVVIIGCPISNLLQISQEYYNFSLKV